MPPSIRTCRTSSSGDETAGGARGSIPPRRRSRVAVDLCHHHGARLKGPVHRALAGNLQQLAALRVIDETLQHDAALEAVDASLAAFAFRAVLRMHLAVQDV